MQRVKLVGGVGALVACGVAGVTVAASPKPPDAPLKPPVDPGTPLAATNAQAAARTTPGLVIPATPVCAVSPSLQPILAQLRAATTRAQRLAILQQLTPDQRQQVTAMLRMRAARCRSDAAPTPDANTQPQPMIEPDVVSGDATPAPITTTYVS
jgi:hypothetical protein